MHRFKKGNEKLTIKEAIAYNKRALKILHNLRPMRLAIDCIMQSLWAISPLVVLFLSSLVISELSGARDTGRIAVYVSLAIGFAFLLSISSHLLAYFQAKLGTPAEFWERREIMLSTHHATMDYIYAEDADVAALLADSQAKSHANGLGLWFLTWQVPSFVGQCIAFIGAGFILSGMFFIPAGDTFITSHLILVLLIGASVIVPSIVCYVLIKKQHRLVQVLFSGLSKYNTLWQYYTRTYISRVEGGMDVRVFGLTTPILQAIKKSQTWFKEGWNEAQCKIHGTNAGIGAVFMVLAFLIIGLRALEGMYDIGEVTRFVGAVTAFTTAMVGIIRDLINLKENAPYLGMTFDYLDLPNTKESKNRQVKLEKSNIFEFHNVSFKYPSTDKYALKNLNLIFHADERLAVVGMNGSGKTTMIKLLCRLYDPTEGKITLNGIDIKDFNYTEYLNLFSVVFQDFALLGQPLGENIASAPKYDANKTTEILEKVGFGERLKSLPKGLETPLYKEFDIEGVSLSGGEMQKVALARAIYKNAPFVILDEPTAALDPIAEYEIYSKFNELIGEKTAVFISHRLSSCRFCHRVAVFHKGEMVQYGTHEGLLEDEGGKYFEMWFAQAQHYEG